MAIVKIDLSDLIELKKSLPVLDARSPAEYNYAHIGGAYSLPIFSDEERRIIGTAYKQESREKAIRIGLDFFGKKLLTLVDVAEKIIQTNNNGNREVILHCWRGGMRSATMAWLLDLYGFKVFLLNGGYKKYRHWVLEQFEKAYPLHIISGCTGSNKTGLLHELKKQNHSVVDLEGLAKHKGSTFGNLNEYPQPTQEHFENELAEQLFSINQNKPSCIWIEGESQRIGHVNVPSAFYKQMLHNPTTKLEIPFEERLIHIMHEYGAYELNKIEKAIIRITKKLGGLEAKTAIDFLRNNDLKSCFEILLKYYDKIYRRSSFTNLDNQKNAKMIVSNTIDAKTNAQLLLNDE